MAEDEVLPLKYNRTHARVYVSCVLLCSATAGSFISKGGANEFVVHRGAGKPARSSHMLILLLHPQIRH